VEWRPLETARGEHDDEEAVVHGAVTGVVLTGPRSNRTR
jgi:hypothetical protein